jgi:proteasome lid subunit RPN8/RPN11
MIKLRSSPTLLYPYRTVLLSEHGTIQVWDLGAEGTVSPRSRRNYRGDGRGGVRLSGTIRIEAEAWQTMLAHACRGYPVECCGALLGRLDAGQKTVTLAVPLENRFPGPQQRRYAIQPEDLLEADRAARRQGLRLLGIYHSHPDCEAYFSATDLENSCPWYSFVVLSIRGGRFDHARSWRPNAEQSAAEEEELAHPTGRTEPELTPT